MTRRTVLQRAATHREATRPAVPFKHAARIKQAGLERLKGQRDVMLWTEQPSSPYAARYGLANTAWRTQSAHAQNPFQEKKWKNFLFFGKFTSLIFSRKSWGKYFYCCLERSSEVLLK